MIARSVGLGFAAGRKDRYRSVLHDVGKIHEEFAPIFVSRVELPNAEFEVMKTHAAKGAALVSKAVALQEYSSPSVRAHHEQWSGTGYPDALAGDAIPIGARIITIADTIDAMTTIRPYRPARSLVEVRAELFRVMGVQFDPKICAALFAAENWEELALEVEIAAREFPAAGYEVASLDDEVPRHSTQFRVH